jgi:hypothetical protein
MFRKERAGEKGSVQKAGRIAKFRPCPSRDKA